METDKVEVNGFGGSALPLFVIGAAAGIALAILLAPRSGTATRRLIGRTVQDGEDWMKGRATAVKDEFMTQAAGLRDGVKAAVGAATQS